MDTTCYPKFTRSGTEHTQSWTAAVAKKVATSKQCLGRANQGCSESTAICPYPWLTVPSFSIYLLAHLPGYTLGHRFSMNQGLWQLELMDLSLATQQWPAHGLSAQGPVLSSWQPVGALSAALGLSLYSFTQSSPRHLLRGALQRMSSGYPKHHQNEPRRHNVEEKRPDISIPAAWFHLYKGLK